jgi:hypothetical protein
MEWRPANSSSMWSAKSGSWRSSSEQGAFLALGVWAEQSRYEGERRGGAVIRVRGPAQVVGGTEDRVVLGAERLDHLDGAASAVGAHGYRPPTGRRLGPFVCGQSALSPCGLALRAGGRLKKLANIFSNPLMPSINDCYEPWTYDYETSPTPRRGSTARSRARSPCSRARI